MSFFDATVVKVVKESLVLEDERRSAMKSRMIVLVVGVALAMAAGQASAALVGHWKLDEASWDGTAGEVVDSSGTGNHGKAENGADTTADAKYGRAGDFDRTQNQFVRIGDDDSLDLTTAITFGCWFKSPVVLDGTSPGMKIMAKSTSWDNGWFIDFHNNWGGGGRWRLDMEINGSMYQAACDVGPGGSLAADTWVHLAGTYDGSTMRLYVDGVEKDHLDIAGSMDVTNIDITLASQGGSWDFATGVIDDAKIYNEVLDADGIAQMMIPEPGTMVLLGIGSVGLLLRRRR